MKQGFTLIELLVVVLIIGILAAIALPQYEVSMEKARLAEAMVVAKSILDAEQRFFQANPKWKCVYSERQIADIDLQGGVWTENGGTETCRNPDTGADIVGNSFRTRNFRYDLGRDDFVLLVYRLDPSDTDITDAQYTIEMKLNGERGCNFQSGNEIAESVCNFVNRM